jgi:phosphohistidine phosphatase SixA
MAVVDRFVLLRHSRAGKKIRDRARDFDRGLDDQGEQVALRLPEVVTSYLRPVVILSSPFRRCVQTVTPLASTLGLEVDEDERLSPGCPAKAVRETFSTMPADSVVCTHGEVIERLFGGAVKCAKGAFWLVERRDGKLFPTHYVKAPARSGRS